MKQTRIQIRGVCSICGNTQALKGDTLVPHGYDLHWGFRNASCAGVHQVHFGHEDAPKFIQQQIDHLKIEEQELPIRIEKSEKEFKREQERLLRRIPSIIKMLESKIVNWRKMEPIEVDIELEEKTLKEKRKEESKNKAAEKAAKQIEKETKKAEREAKAAEKWKIILGNNYHCIELDNEVIVEWTSEYETRKEFEESHCAATRKYFEDNGINDHYDRMAIIYRLTHRVRSKEAKGKQLHKF